ncbi:MAG: hypothetical protein IPG09_15560 [Ignavibacteria bacterium]|nr:hypothetical protein [Ignavibacteria bacterium]
MKDGFFEERSKENTKQYFDEYFEKWWKFYPRKEGKNQAKEFMRNENFSEADFKKLFQATRNYNETVTDREIKFIKAPINFLPVWKDFL